MNDQVKFIVEKLNKEPFNKSLNFINFDNLQGNSLIQILNDVFAEVDTKVFGKNFDFFIQNYLKFFKFKAKN